MLVFKKHNNHWLMRFSGLGFLQNIFHCEAENWQSFSLCDKIGDIVSDEEVRH